ncbi:uncharacterized protein LOC132286605 [Cornus florida]|uniref:uncharacterized protein LOC132286605 n=1 Tax=Cornus florida TaxID=4283 RepID=UPI00289E2D71|nr:uncharacterized protein LOC132286605 [Cornus florida]
MGKKLDALLGRNLKTSKFKPLAKLAISRVAILKNQRHVRYSQAQSDVIQLLNLGHQERALHRVEYVIKEQNMLDVFVMIENYCHLLIERVELIQNNRECPDELKEAISSLIFAASRCGEFPELQQIREISTSRFGKEFTAQAVELRNNCRVNPKMIQMLATRQESLGSRKNVLKKNVLKKIASDNGIILYLEDDTSMEEKQDVNQEKQHPELGVDAQHLPEEMKRGEELSDSMKARKKYRDVAAAAHEAFESAAYAAAAARAAVELSRAESWDEHPDDHSSSKHQQGKLFDPSRSSKSNFQLDMDTASEDVKHSERGLGFNKIHPVDSFSSESESEEMEEKSYRNHLKELERSKKKAVLEKTLSASSLSSDENDWSNRKKSLIHDMDEPLSKEIAFDESDDDEVGENQDKIAWLNLYDWGSDKKSNSPINEFPNARQHNAVKEETISYKKGYMLHSQSPKWMPLKSQADNAVAEENVSNKKTYMLHSQSPKWISLKSQADPMIYSVEGRSNLGSKHHLNAEKHLYLQQPGRHTKPVSMRTR